MDQTGIGKFVCTLEKKISFRWQQWQLKPFLKGNLDEAMQCPIFNPLLFQTRPFVLSQHIIWDVPSVNSEVPLLVVLVVLDLLAQTLFEHITSGPICNYEASLGSSRAFLDLLGSFCGNTLFQVLKINALQWWQTWSFQLCCITFKILTIGF